jgi:hypothetical protein
MNVAEQSRQVIERLVPQLEADGYTVFVEPSRELLPPFMEGYVPDAIALGPKKCLAIEIIVEGARPPERIEYLKRRFQNEAGWELRVYFARPAGSHAILQPQPKAAIEDSLRAVESLVTDGQAAPALLLAWGILEALGRALFPEKFAGPQTPARLVEVLAADGQITPSEADLLRKLARQRTQLIHGDLEVAADPGEVRSFVGVLKMLLASSQEATS